jgi:CRP-like cAMP-binding protein
MSEGTYRVFGLDRSIYGPVSTATLLEWAQDGRVQKGTWVHSDLVDAWRRVEELPELKAVFEPKVSGETTVGADVTPSQSRVGVSVKTLTRLRMFADMPTDQLEPFAREMVEESYRPFTFIVQQGNHGDAMYFVIQGKVGVSMKGVLTESFLVALNIGDTFGEMSLFDPAPRSADVRSETDVVVLKLTVDALQKVCRDAPAAANRFLWNVARLLAARMRTMDRRTSAARDMDAAGREVPVEGS